MLNSCAAGVGVMNIDNGFGAGCLAHRINVLGERDDEREVRDKRKR
jgi:NCAIR mutase (PurE)-related protein